MSSSPVRSNVPTCCNRLGAKIAIPLFMVCAMMVSACGEGRQWEHEPSFEEITDEALGMMIVGETPDMALETLRAQGFYAVELDSGRTLNGWFRSVSPPPLFDRLRVGGNRKHPFWQVELIYAEVDSGGTVDRVYNRFYSRLFYP